MRSVRAKRKRTGTEWAFVPGLQARLWPQHRSTLCWDMIVVSTSCDPQYTGHQVLESDLHQSFQPFTDSAAFLVYLLVKIAKYERLDPQVNWGGFNTQKCCHLYHLNFTLKSGFLFFYTKIFGTFFLCWWMLMIIVQIFYFNFMKQMCVTSEFSKHSKPTKSVSFIFSWFSYASAEGERGTNGGKRLDSNTFGTRF